MTKDEIFKSLEKSNEDKVMFRARHFFLGYQGLQETIKKGPDYIYLGDAYFKIKDVRQWIFIQHLILKAKCKSVSVRTSMISWHEDVLIINQ